MKAKFQYASLEIDFEYESNRKDKRPTQLIKSLRITHHGVELYIQPNSANELRVFCVSSHEAEHLRTYTKVLPT